MDWSTSFHYSNSEGGCKTERKLITRPATERQREAKVYGDKSIEGFKDFSVMINIHWYIYTYVGVEIPVARNLKGTNHIQVLSGQDVVHTVLDGEKVLVQHSTGGFGLLNRDGRLGQATLALSTGVFGLDAKLRELRMGNLVEELGFAWQHLPLVSKVGKVIKHSGSITGKKLSGLVVSKKTDGVSKHGLVSIELNTDELLVELDDNGSSGVLGAQVNNVLTLVRGGELLHNGETSKTCVKVSLLFVVDPVVSVGVIGISGALNLENVIANLDGNILDVGPVADNLGTDLNVQAKSGGKVSILDQSEITLSMVFKVLFVVPGSEVRIATSSAVFVTSRRCNRSWSGCNRSWSGRTHPSVRHGYGSLVVAAKGTDRICWVDHDGNGVMVCIEL
mmetsp:Transcript_21797/g.53885  ORF Transcript_21797/g.53885 Transcript_21797/m.53885 type:complete len:392 (+) Transcript_21797:1519-2694(+)